MLENKKETYIKTVKHNLRTFLLTKGYKIDTLGSFDTRNDSGEIKFGTLADLRRKLFLKIDDKDNSFFITEPDKKLKALFSDESKSLDPYFIKEICEMYGFPIGEIYSSNKVALEQAQNTVLEAETQTLAAKKPFSVLSKDSHGAYFSTFYGFTLDHNPNEEEKIIEFNLSIFEDENGLPKAEYVFYNRRNEKQGSC